MKQLVYSASVINGQLAIQGRKQMSDDFKAIGNCENVTLIVKLQGTSKTVQQIRAFHGPVLEQIQAWEMAANGVYKSLDRIKHDLKESFLQRVKRYWSDGSPVIIKIQHPEKKGVFMDWHMEETPSLSSLSKDQMRGFIEAIREYYLHTHGLDIEIGNNLFPTIEK